MEILDIEEVQTAPKTELAPIERAAIALESSKTEQHLRELAVKFIDITEIQDANGYDQAHRAKMELKRAPVASAIILAVAEFWHTDNKTAARWITERAAEIESLQ